MTSFDSMGRLSETGVKGLKVRSALNPALWLSAITVPVCLTGAYLFSSVPWIRGALVVVGLVPILTACAIYV